MDRFSIAHYAQNCKWKSKKILCKPESHEKTADFSGNFHRTSKKIFYIHGVQFVTFSRDSTKIPIFRKDYSSFHFKKNRKFLWQQSVIWKLPNLFRIHTRKRCFIPYTRSTFPERRHLEQTYTWQGVPFTTAFTRFTLGFHVLLERLWEWDTLIPNVTPLPQNSHFAIFYCTSLNKLTDSIISYCNKKCKPFFSFFENFFWTSEICIFHLKK